MVAGCSIQRLNTLGAAQAPGVALFASRLPPRISSEITMDEHRPWWQPHGFADRLPVLRQRNAIKAALRAYFGDGGFVEVETPILQVSPGNETHIAAFATTLVGSDGASS